MSMKQRLEHFEALLGPTPVLPVTLTVGGRPRVIHLKLEGHNVAGSIKARTAFGLVRALVESGELQPGGRLLESTSGNLGIALAMLARYLGVSFTAVVDPLIASECLERLNDLGAEIITVTERDESGGYLLSRLDRIAELREQDSSYVWTNQYDNPENPAIHRGMTGPEMFRQLPRAPDAVFAAISTGGTFSGLSQFFRSASPATKMIAVDIEGSIAFHGSPGKRHLSGIGASRPSTFLDSSLVDQLEIASISESAHFCRLVQRSAGLHIGASAGSVVAACVRYLEIHPEIELAVCLCADSGDKYASTIYSETWLRSIGVELPADDLAPATPEHLPGAILSGVA
ncbi:MULTISPECIES: pyridoxal-phosphate dependent enzyme [unclassified Kitasatospora]|uniref:pyridoxal-phosphate dependent enzyme n=1 Tax=unclassified Kitasatospora TaxID=2633591 RepID=UPI0007C86357|nr:MULTISPECIES: pyridoxal-phosphate dependent enzyme [unclassified Kitasatospora]